MTGPFSVIPATRSVGSVDPPGDMNNTSLQLAAMGGSLNVLNTAFAGGADPTGVTASDGAAAAAVVALGSGGGALVFAPGTYKFLTGVTITQPGIFLVPAVPGTVTLDYYGSGDCVRMYNTATSPPVRGGILGNIVIDGTHASAGASGIHAGDLFQTRWDVTVQNFTGTGSKGAWFDNQYSFTEMITGTVGVTNCTSGVVFDHNDVSGSSTGSFDRLMLRIPLVTAGAGNGVVFQNGAFAIDYDLDIYGNDVYGTGMHYVLTLTGSDGAGFSRLYGAGNLNIGVELRNPGSGTQPGTINFATQGSNLITGARGRINFGGNAAFAGSNNARNSFQFEGPVFGDSTLMRTISGVNPFNAGTGLANGGTIIPQSEVNTISPTSNLTAMILQKWPVGLGVPLRVTVINRSTSHTITFDVSGTSNVATGTSCVIQPNSAQTFFWDEFVSLWIPAQ